MLVSVGSGAIEVTGDNSFSGGVTLEGDLLLGSPNALGSTGTITFNSGTLKYSAANQVDYSPRFASDSPFSYFVDTNGQDVTWAGNLNTTAAVLVKKGEGALTLAGDNTYTGASVVRFGGILQFAKRTSLYHADEASWTTDNLIVDSGAVAGFNVGGTGEFTTADIDTIKSLVSGDNASGFKWGASLGIDPSNAPGGTLSYGSVISDPDGSQIGFTKLGGGELVLTAPNTYTGGTWVREGTLKVGHASALGAYSYGGIRIDGTLDFNGHDFNANVVNGVGSISNTSATPVHLTMDGFDFFSSQFAGNIIQTDGEISITHNADPDSALELLGTTYTYTGDTVMNGAGLIINSNNATTFTSERIELNSGYIALSGNGSVSIAGDIVGDGSISSSKRLANLSGTNSYSGGTWITEGSLSFRNTAAMPSTGTISVSAGATIGLGVSNGAGWFASTDVDALFAGTLAGVSNDAASRVGIDTTAGDFTYSTSATGSRGLTKLGNNTLTLTGNHSYAGGTTVQMGALVIDTAGSIAGPTTAHGGATFGGSGSTGDMVTYEAGSRGTFTHGSPLAIGGPLVLATAGDLPVVHLTLPNDLGNGIYPLATYTNPGSSGGFDTTPVIDSGSLAGGAVATISTTDGTVTLHVSDATTFADWAASYGLTADPLTNLGNNLIHFAFGLAADGTPMGPSRVTGATIEQRGMPTVMTANIGGGIEYKMLFNRLKTSNLTYTVQFSTNMSDWQTIVTTPTVVADDGQVEACTVPFPLPTVAPGLVFGRVLISVEP